MGKKIGETKPQFLIQKVQVIFVALFASVMTHIWHTKNGTKLVQQFVQNCSRYMAKSSIKDIADPVSPHFSRTKSMKQLLTAFLTFIHDISSIPCFQPVLCEDTLRVRFCWYGDCRTMGVGMWGAHSIWCVIPGVLLCVIHSIVMYFMLHTTSRTK